MELRKHEAGTSSKLLKEKLMDVPFRKKRGYGFLEMEPELYPIQHRKQIASKTISETFLDTEQALSHELGNKPLAFTFVPSVRRLPAHFQIVEPSKLTFTPTKESNSDRSKETVSKSTVFSDYLATGSGASQTIGMQDSRSHRANSNQQISQKRESTVSEAEQMERNDVYQAEFVMITDSDGEEDIIARGNEKQPTVIAVITDHRQARIQSVAVPWDSTKKTHPGETAVGVQSASGQQNELCQQKRSQLMASNKLPGQASKSLMYSTVDTDRLTSSLSTTDHLSHKAPDIHIVPPTNQKIDYDFANLNEVSSEESYRKGQFLSGPANHDSSAFFKATGLSPSCSTNHESETLISRSSMFNRTSNSKLPTTIQMKVYTIPNSFCNIHEKIQRGPRKNQIPFSHFSSETELSNLGAQSPSSYPLRRSRTLSPISVQVRTHSLSPSPKPLEPHFYGSSSTIYSTNEPFSPLSSNTNLSRSGITSPLPARLSFLTSVLKSGKSTDQKTFSPEPSFSKFSSTSLGSPSPSPDQMSKLNPTISKKSPSKFIIGASNQKESQKSLFSDQSPNQSKILPLPSGPNMASVSPTKWHRALSPNRERGRPSAMSSCREKVIFPTQFQTYGPKPPSPTPRCISPLHLKPPLKKDTQNSAKRSPMPVKSRKVPMFSPSVSSAVSHSFSPTKQRVNLPHTPEKSPSPSKFFQSVPFLRKQAQISLPTPELNVTFPSHSDHRSSLPMTYNTYSYSPYPSSLSPYSNYRPYSVSPRPGQSPTASVTQCTSPIPIHSPSSYSALSRSSNLSSVLSLPQSPDHETKKPKEYKIKSSYKVLAAIPTNTLLLEQKALDEAVKTPDGVEDKLDTHSELCSPAQLRQKTEEVCAAIDKVLQEPLPMHHHDIASVSPQGLDVPKMAVTLPKTPGRETRYAVLRSPIPKSTESKLTKPGVIRSLPLKEKIILKKEEGCHLNPFKKYVEGTSGREMQHLSHSTMWENKSEPRQYDGNGRKSKGTCLRNERTPYCRQLLLIKEDMDNTSAKQSKGKK
ncbi:muscular LMNA-interacting protein isoform X2 [Microcaecilia unicolor]|uniref:Muscular LMNA-interacting protein isoform X2 n=1 Tax=Microcaecilia unicolor TaxID=1415580 RepID=A0A6P7XNY4_9AMPH|nr:muscular LMNA-interacting protein isoform X2 [Microcaecilia unicolor]